jgi:hypothetical protein
MANFRTNYKKTDKEDLKIVKTNDEKGFKTLNASDKKNLESVRVKATVQTKRKNLAPPSSQIYDGADSSLLA